MYNPSRYDDNNGNVHDAGVKYSIRQCIELYVLTDKYQVDDLRQIAKRHVTRKFGDIVEQWYQRDRLNSLEAVKCLVDIIKCVYSMAPPTDRTLGLVVAGICSPHRQRLMKQDMFRRYVESNATFCFDLLEHSSRYWVLYCCDEACGGNTILVPPAAYDKFGVCPTCGQNSLGILEAPIPLNIA